MIRAQLHVSSSSRKRRAEGHVMRRPLELPMVRKEPALFHDGTAMHRIDEIEPVLRSRRHREAEATQRRAVSLLAGSRRDLLQRRSSS